MDPENSTDFIQCWNGSFFSPFKIPFNPVNGSLVINGAIAAAIERDRGILAIKGEPGNVFWHIGSLRFIWSEGWSKARQCLCCLVCTLTSSQNLSADRGIGAKVADMYVVCLMQMT